MKVCLINPPWRISEGVAPDVYQPMGLAYIASYLRKHGHDVSIIDSIPEGWKTPGEYWGLHPDKIAEMVGKIKPDLIGMSVPFSSNSGASFELSRMLKERFGTPIAIGGAHPSVLPKESLKDSGADYVILSEGEERMRKIADALDEGRKPIFDGLCYNTKNGAKLIPQESYIKDPDTLPFPARDLLPMEKYFDAARNFTARLGQDKHLRWTTVITSRGCPFNCVFCSIHCISGFAWRPRTPENVIKELDQITSQFGINHILFEDDNMTLKIERAKKIYAEMIRKKYDVTWTAPNGLRADTLDMESLKLMKKSGCVGFSIAVESGDQQVNNNIVRKRLNLRTVEKVVSMSKKVGLPTTAFFIIGFPGEKIENMKTTIRFARKLIRRGLGEATFYIATPLPGTDMRKIAEENDYLVADDFNTLNPYNPLIKTQDFTPSDVAKMKIRATRDVKMEMFLADPLGFTRRYGKPRIVKGYLRRLVHLLSK
ncbi:MAG: B12-binding domain-containing radical SAM protein [Candidatus Aenigmarchaeota archaeon]|nr:B12-binding domain-containing radical SAM protein [Candidatus Aenigmarchaeota archaeon]